MVFVQHSNSQILCLLHTTLFSIHIIFMCIPNEYAHEMLLQHFRHFTVIRFADLIILGYIGEWKVKKNFFFVVGGVYIACTQPKKSLLD